MNPTVSVIMVTYHTGPVLWRALETVLRQEHLHELVIVNNGNSIAAVERLLGLAEAHPVIRIISGHGNIGFAAACNLGVSRASGRYVALLNPDCLLPPHTFTKMLAAMYNHPEAWVAGGVILHADGIEQSGSRRAIMTPSNALVEHFKLHRLNPSWQRLNWHQLELPLMPVMLPAVSGAFMFMERMMYEKIGGMDTGYFLHVEDMDFCLRVQERGGKILFVPEVQIVHFGGTSDAPSLWVEWQKTKGFVRYFRKNFAEVYGAGILTGLAVLIYLRYGMMLIKAFLRCFLNPKRWLRKRAAPTIPLEERRLNFLNTYHILEERWRVSGQSLAAREHLFSHAPILLAGSTAQNGLCILRRLLALGLDVTALYRSQVIDIEHPCLEWLYADVKNGDIHLRGEVETLIYTAPLWWLPHHLQALRHAGVKRLVAFSSTSVFTKASSGNRYERELIERLRRAEEQVTTYCEKLDIHWTIFRPTLITGIGMDSNVSALARWIKALGFFPMVLPGDGLRQPVHPDDLAMAALSVLDNPKTHNQFYTLAGGEVLSYREMISRMFKTLGKKERIVTVKLLPLLLNLYGFFARKPQINSEIAERMNADMVFNNQPAHNDFGYAPRGFLPEGIENLEPEFKQLDVVPEVLFEAPDKSRPLV